MRPSMKFIIAVLILGIVSVGGVAAFGQSENNQAQSGDQAQTQSSNQPSDQQQSDQSSQGQTLGSGGQTVTVQLSAQDMAFDKQTITVPAGAHVVVQFTNNDSVPHNFAVYQTRQAQQVIFQGENITGPDESTTYEFDAPGDPGTYFFRCDVHPVQMTGDFVVQ